MNLLGLYCHRDGTALQAAHTAVRPFGLLGLSWNRQKQHNHVDRLSLHERRRDLLIAS